MHLLLRTGIPLSRVSDAAQGHTALFGIVLVAVVIAVVSAWVQRRRHTDDDEGVPSEEELLRMADEYEEDG